MSLLSKLGKIIAPVRIGNVCWRCGFAHAYRAQVFNGNGIEEKKLCMRCNAEWRAK